MKANEMLNEIKTLLNIEVKLEEQKLENGTVVSAEAFEKGKEIFIVTDDEKVAMPVGEYILEDGRLLVVEAEGVIADVREVSDEVPAKEEEETEDLEEEVKEEMSYATKEELAEVKTMVEEIKAMLEPKEEMSEEVKEEIVEEVKEELSAVKPIKHNPEASTPQKKQVQFAKGNFNTTLDRVLSKLNK
mgnify:CR=1 FL=1|jgi:hypothetical protein